MFSKQLIIIKYFNVVQLSDSPLIKYAQFINYKTPLLTIFLEVKMSLVITNAAFENLKNLIVNLNSFILFKMHRTPFLARITIFVVSGSIYSYYHFRF